MIVFVAGMPRAGSMWTYNVVRAIFEAKGFQVLPETIPADESVLITEALNSTVNENEVYFIKTHLRLKSPLPTKHDIKFICNVRDIRDASISFMKFMRADIGRDAENGIKAMMNMMSITDYYLTTFGNNVLGVRFEDISNNPQIVLENIAEFFKIELSKGEKTEILKDFSKANIQKKLSAMKKIKLNALGQVENEEQQSKFNTIKNFDGTYRVYDKTTAFQSGHITSTTEGEWKTHFSENQIGRINSITREWLLKYGYKI